LQGTSVSQASSNLSAASSIQGSLDRNSSSTLSATSSGSSFSFIGSDDLSATDEDTVQVCSYLSAIINSKNAESGSANFTFFKVDGSWIEIQSSVWFGRYKEWTESKELHADLSSAPQFSKVLSKFRDYGIPKVNRIGGRSYYSELDAEKLKQRLTSEGLFDGKVSL